MAKDRLIRILNGPNVQFELETNGIPTCVTVVRNLTASDSLFLYGTAPLGKVTMVAINFSANKPEVKWEVPEGKSGRKSPVECLTVSDSRADLFVGRSDGTIDGYTFASILDLDGKQLVSFCCDFYHFQLF